MLRIRGTVGQWPVDLTLELDDEDWARLGAQLKPVVAQDSPVEAPQTRPASQDDKTWEMAVSILKSAGQMPGPELLGQLEALTGSTAAGKRLLVRLRHSANVKVDSGADAPLYAWVQ